MSMGKSPIKKVYIGDRVYSEIKRMLIERSILPGDRIDKSELCRQLRVSLTPVNEAVKRLVGEDLIEKRGNSGFFAREYTPQYLIDFYEARAAMESMALRRCIENLDDDELFGLIDFGERLKEVHTKGDAVEYLRVDREFHRSILMKSGNRMFIRFIKTFNMLTTSLNMGVMRSPDETIVEHLEIIDAMRRREAALAQKLMMEHHMRSRKSLSEHLTKGDLKFDLLFTDSSNSVTD
ncbi:hypothetical protein B4O97_09375 [Marispirochaeta aestuarii]|uniref:HTH gntR-type domain-containing protein n=1 Tax=Marispirochaeta aestuarii TaxID=1963862 RepID=A0A1Y1RZC0_9SPIO|nr:GntR family transcriptional regulator [Marispirochaeta aestuarii]ORC35374.1 hypothetical protein B4O97_09375 [Marispirochaeta aestuarii]